MVAASEWKNVNTAKIGSGIGEMVVDSKYVMLGELLTAIDIGEALGGVLVIVAAAGGFEAVDVGITEVVLNISVAATGSY